MILRPFFDNTGDRATHRALMVGTLIVLSLASVIVRAFTGMPLRWLLTGSVVVAALMGTVGWKILSFLTQGLSNTLHAAGGGRREREYSEQEALVVRGEFQRAADSFRTHLVVFPEDIAAKIRLAGLLETHLGDAEGAEALYREALTSNPERDQLMMIRNALIDMYRRSGSERALKRELARLAKDFKGTAAGDSARIALDRLIRSEQA